MEDVPNWLLRMASHRKSRAGRGFSRYRDTETESRRRIVRCRRRLRRSRAGHRDLVKASEISGDSSVAEVVLVP